MRRGSSHSWSGETWYGFREGLRHSFMEYARCGSHQEGYPIRPRFRCNAYRKLSGAGRGGKFVSWTLLRG